MRRRPVIGVSGSHHMAEGSYPVQMAGARNLEAVARVCGATPLIVPGLPDIMEVGELLEVCDGFLFTGGRANVHPRFYGEELTPAHGGMDEGRDDVALALIRAAVDRAIPVFGVCRGHQELAVAYGSTLHPEIRDLPGKQNHRMPPGEKDPAVIFRKRHRVTLVRGGEFERLLETNEIVTNSLHGQAVLKASKRIAVEGLAEDGVVEAISVRDAPGFALGVQWHAEFDAENDPVSRALFGAFGEAARAVMKGR